MVHSELGQHAKAEELFRRALELRLKRFGPDHPAVAVSLSNLGGLYDTLHRYHEAEQLHLRALAIWEKTVEPYPNDRANCLNNLAALYGRSQGKIELAIPLLQEALAVWETAYTRRHPISATGLVNLAVAYCRAKQLDKAESLFVEAIRVFEQSFPPPHPKLTWTLSNYAYLLNKTDRRAEAKIVLGRVRPPLPAGFGESVVDLDELLSLRK